MGIPEDGIVRMRVSLEFNFVGIAPQIIIGVSAIEKETSMILATKMWFIVVVVLLFSTNAYGQFSVCIIIGMCMITFRLSLNLMIVARLSLFTLQHWMYTYCS